MARRKQGFNPLAGIRAFQTQEEGKMNAQVKNSFNPLAGIRAFQTFHGVRSFLFNLHSFNPLAGIRAFQTVASRLPQRGLTSRFQSPCGD